VEFLQIEGAPDAKTSDSSVENADALPTSPWAGIRLRAHVDLLLPLDYIVAKHKSYFTHRPKLAVVHASGAERVTRRDTACTNPAKVSAKEEASILKGGR
jgi:hypothetical protein